MARKTNPETERARSATRGEIPLLLHEASEEVLLALLENPLLDEPQLCRLLERRELSETLLDAVAKRSYRVRRALAFHAHAPRLVAMRLVRELYLMDLVQLSLLPSVPKELRRLAEELLLARLPQLPLGQKLQLARRASARVAGGLVAEGHEQVARTALDNAFLTEAQVLKVLAREKLPPAVVAAVARHRKWSQIYNVRLALLRHPRVPLERVLGFLPDLTSRDLNELSELTTVSVGVRQHIRREITRRA